jgi:pseudouridine-5'-phosphate glycosidase
MLNHTLLTIASEVAAGLSANKPVVALESTVIAHGLPRPQNLETALSLQEIVRDAGVIPATIAIIKGKLSVGINDEEIRLLAETNGIKKISTRDLPVAVAMSWDGATTVASTAWIAHRAGVKVFATGGIGGVHHGSLPDVSADLPELTRSPIVVVCSGAKIVLDLPATREWLETNGITVVGYQCDEMPAFYTSHSRLLVDVRADGADEVAKLFRAQQSLGLESALLVTVPVPAAYDMPEDLLQDVLDEALEEAKRECIAGSELTPFLLSRMAKSSEGATLRANIALLENNTRVAAQIAQSLEK